MIGSESRIERSGIDLVIERAQGWFEREQYPEGYWWAELESNATMDAEYLLLTHFLGARNEGHWRGVAQDIRNYQRDDGSWAMYHGAPGDLSTSIECYFALKLAGDPADAPHLARARAFIRERGGIARARTFTRIWLALFGQWSWDELPVMPPELMLLPASAPFSIYRFSSWARGTIVPLLLLMNDRPVRPVPTGARLDELRVPDAAPRPPRDGIDRLFRAIDTALRGYRRLPFHPFRQRARKAAEQWILAHQEADGSWGGIQPPWVYSLMALSALGHPLDHPALRKGLEGMHDRWMLHHADGRVRVQACLSPVWDTGLSLLALLESGVEPSASMVERAARWLLREEIRVPGDWCVQVQGVEPSGWAFEFENDLYPDVDDTAVVVLALRELGMGEEAVRRGLAWIDGMQSEGGGWGAFDKECNNEVFTFIPFADHNAMIDPSCEDITGRTLEALIGLGFSREDPAVRGAIRFLHETQDFSGTWYGRWGCNYIYGTFLALRGLAAVDETGGFERAARWMMEKQNPDGGWGELQHSYDDPMLKGIGPSTPSQTAWALLALIAADKNDCDAVRRGVEYLLRNQRADGSWFDETWTATGFPKVFYLRYHLYATYFPLWALSEYRDANAS